MVEWAGLVGTVATMALADLLLGLSLFTVRALREMGTGHCVTAG